MAQVNVRQLGVTLHWIDKDITKDIELTYEEYTVVVAILRMARNVYEKKELWEGF